MGCGWRDLHGQRYLTYLILASFDLKDGVPFPYGASFSVRKRAVTRKEKLGSHQDMGDTEGKENSDDDDEEKEEGSDVMSSESAEVSGWKMSTFNVSEDPFVACIFS